MLFNSINYLIFFPIVIIAYFIIPDRFKHHWLLIASYFFYMCWNVKYVLLILISTIVTYACGLIIEQTLHKKTALSACITINLLILFFFKYYAFTADTLISILSEIGLRITLPSFDIMLPVGISFYTFQALGYTIDVYRGNIKAEKNFIRYALFVSFFPQLVAGPIERCKDLLPQLSIPHRFNADRFRNGFLLMLWGYFLKVVIADRIAIVVDTVYNNIYLYPGLYQCMAAGLFAFQIYCDFAGYSTIAVGSAKILGIDLMDNFDAPYMASSVAEFWRRWHISLTTWFKDYLYIPLGGNRKGKYRKYLNILVVFAISGIWHGAEWSFLIWGILNGMYQIIGELLTPLRHRFRNVLKIRTNSLLYRIIGIIITFSLVDLSWIFFRAHNTWEAIQVLKLMFSTYNPDIIFTGKIYCLGVEADSFRMMAFCILILIVADVLKYNDINVRNWIINRSVFIRSSIVVFSILFILVFGAWGPAFDIANFIYFQF